MGFIVVVQIDHFHDAFRTAEEIKYLNYIIIYTDMNLSAALCNLPRGVIEWRRNRQQTIGRGRRKRAERIVIGFDGGKRPH